MSEEQNDKETASTKRKSDEAAENYTKNDMKERKSMKSEEGI